LTSFKNLLTIFLERRRMDGKRQKGKISKIKMSKTII
jgi:hypothetical protein